MSLLTERLPESVESGGERYAVNPDFRLMVELETTAEDGLASDALEDILWKFYLQNPPSDPEAAVSGLLWFYRCGKEEAEEGRVSGRTRVYDFGQDEEALYTSFLQAYRIDLSVDAVHWWAFRRLMFGLPADTPFAQRLHYRTSDTSGMGKEQKKHYARMKKLYAIRQRASGRETLAQRDARMLAYVERRFSEVDGGQAGEKG